MRVEMIEKKKNFVAISATVLTMCDVECIVKQQCAYAPVHLRRCGCLYVGQHWVLPLQCSCLRGSAHGASSMGKRRTEQMTAVIVRLVLVVLLVVL